MKNLFWHVIITYAFLCGNGFSSEDFQKISYGPGWKICFFDRPGSFQVLDGIIVISYIYDKNSGKWIDVISHPKITRNNLIYRQLLTSNVGPNKVADEVDAGDVVAFKKLVKLIFINFKRAGVNIEFSTKPSYHRTVSSEEINSYIEKANRGGI